MRPSSAGAGDDPRPAEPGEWRAVIRLAPYLLTFRGRVLVAMLCLVGAKAATVTLPIVLKHIVDALDQAEQSVIVLPLAMLLTYGVLRFATVAFGELRDVVFGRVTERAMSRVALEVFRHLNNLDLEFHLARRTGGLSRDIERGVAGIRFLLRFMAFNIVPTLIEIALVAGILLVGYSWTYAGVIALAVTIYITYSVMVTEWRTGYVRHQNRLASRANTRAIDALLNFETVKYFGNEGFEAGRYADSLQAWEVAMAKNRISLATLNLGQAVIVGAAVTVMMILAARQVVAGTMTLGDLVLVNAYMLQLFVPLNFLGFVYREIKQALADIGRMFRLTDIQPAVQDRADATVRSTAPAAVTFDAVDFGYDTRRQILHGVDFTIATGETVAIVGSSGAGKSTIARLLFRFYDVDGGAIRVDGIDSVTCPRPACAPISAWSRRMLFCSTTRWATTSPTVVLMPPRTRSAKSFGLRICRTSSAACPMVWIRRWANVGSSCPGAKSSASQSPVRCSSSRGYWYLTRRPVRWTPNRSVRWLMPCARWRPITRRWSSRIAYRRWPMPTGSWCWNKDA